MKAGACHLIAVSDKQMESKMKKVNQYIVAGVAAFGLLVGQVSAKDISKVLGGINISGGEVVGDLSSVNGGVVLADNAKAEDIDTVNGKVRLGKQVTIDSASTVNGGITAEQGVIVNQSLETVNGSIRVASNGRVNGDIESVNGSISLKQTTVGGSLSIHNGDIHLEGSEVAGDITVRKNKGMFKHSSNNKPDIVIDANSRVNGTIHLYREANLTIEKGATVGEVIRHYED
jgi:DUF4097 and DUF4098 domain-containing protein YvlB